METAPPTAEAVWSIRPQGLPKKRFSAAWPNWASVTALRAPPQKRWLRMTPMSTSYAAEEERPDPAGTLEVT